MKSAPHDGGRKKCFHKSGYTIPQSPDKSDNEPIGRSQESCEDARFVTRVRNAFQVCFTGWFVDCRLRRVCGRRMDASTSKRGVPGLRATSEAIHWLGKGSGVECGISFHVGAGSGSCPGQSQYCWKAPRVELLARKFLNPAPSVHPSDLGLPLFGDRGVHGCESAQMNSGHSGMLYRSLWLITKSKED